MRVMLVVIVVGLAILALLLAGRGLFSPGGRATVTVRSAGVAQAIRSTRVYTLADGSVAYRLAEMYTTTIGGIDFTAWVENRPYDEYGRELPLHYGWHYVHVAAVDEISPTGRWDVGLSSIVTEVVSWRHDLTQTGVVTMLIGSDGLVITRPVFDQGELVSMVVTNAVWSPLVTGWLSTTKFISESGAIVPGTISATLDMIFEVHNSSRGLTLNFQGDTGVLTMTEEQSPFNYSDAAYVGDFDFAQFQVRAMSTDSDAPVAWRPQFAPMVNGDCGAATDWADGAASQWVHLSPDHGDYVWQPLHIWAETSGDEAMGFQVRVRNACVRLAFWGQPGMTFTPTAYLKPFNPK